jgi:hypothetical protein
MVGYAALTHPTHSLYAYVLVMPGLVPGIHVLPPGSKKDVDGRDEPGHDELESAESRTTRQRTSDATPSISISIFGLGSAITTQVVRAG